MNVATWEMVRPGGLYLVRGRTPVDALCAFCDRFGLVMAQRIDADGMARVRSKGPLRVHFGVRVYECNYVCPVRFSWGLSDQGKYTMTIAPRVFRVRVASW